MDSFSGVRPVPERRDSSNGSWWSESSNRAEQSDTMTAAGAEFADYLVGYFRDFSQVQSTRLRVLAIRRDEETPDQFDLNVLLTGSGSGKGGERLSHESTHEVKCRFTDEKQLAAGPILSHWSVIEQHHRVARSRLFEEVTQEAGLDALGLPDNWKTRSAEQYTMQVAVDDFDRDGYPDIAISTAFSHRILKSVEGRSFQDVTVAVGVPPPGPVNNNLVSWFDFNNDDFPDLLLSDRLFKNHNGERFEDVTATSGLKFGIEPSGCAVADFDGDGWLDVYVLYQKGGAGRARQHGWIEDNDSGAPNVLWRNTGDGRFVDVTQRVGVGNGNRLTFAAAWLHANDDSRPDLYIANDFGANALLINRGDRFEDASDCGVADFATSMGVTSGDIDNDGRSEIYVANMYSKMGRRIIGHVHESDYPPGIFAQIEGSCAGNRLYRLSSDEPSSRRYEEISEPFGVNDVGWAYAPAMADFDGDGYLDIYATTGFLSFDRGKPDG